MPRKTDSDAERKTDSFLFGLANSPESYKKLQALYNNQFWAGFFHCAVYICTGAALTGLIFWLCT